MKRFLLSFLLFLVFFSADLVQAASVESASLASFTTLGVPLEKKKVLRSLALAELESNGVQILKKGAQVKISGSVTRLDRDYVLSLTLREDGSVRSRKLKISNFDDIDLAMRRVMVALLKDEEIADLPKDAPPKASPAPVPGVPTPPPSPEAAPPRAEAASAPTNVNINFPNSGPGNPRVSSEPAPNPPPPQKSPESSRHGGGLRAIPSADPPFHAGGANSSAYNSVSPGGSSPPPYTSTTSSGPPTPEFQAHEVPSPPTDPKGDGRVRAARGWEFSVGGALPMTDAYLVKKVMWTFGAAYGWDIREAILELRADVMEAFGFVSQGYESLSLSGQWVWKDTPKMAIYSGGEFGFAAARSTSGNSNYVTGFNLGADIGILFLRQADINLDARLRLVTLPTGLNGSFPMILTLFFGLHF